jgi:hypothetical protein
MKKLSLDLAELRVESFDTFVPEAQRGTVRGNGSCYTYSCPGTCGATPPSDSTLEKMDLSRTNCPQCCV